MAEKIRAWVVTQPGPFDKTLKLKEDAPHPCPSSTKQQLAKGQLLVEVASAALNPVDYKLAEMGLPARAILKLPKTAAMDFSGRVVRAGQGVSMKPGDAVYGTFSPMTSSGSLAQYILADNATCVPIRIDETQDEDKIAAGFDQAAGLGGAALSAYQSIAPYVKQGDNVFINGGAGGTGTYGIQIAKLLGCHVTVTCSAAKVDLCRSLGADEVIDYTKTDVLKALAEKGQVFNLCVDNVGNSPATLYTATNTFLVPGGKSPYVAVGAAMSVASVATQVRGRLLPGFLGGAKHPWVQLWLKHDRREMEKLASWLGDGKLRTVIDSTFEFDKAPDAFKRLKTGRVVGKVIVRVGKPKRNKEGKASSKK